MKKLTVLLLVATMGMSMAACGKEAEDASATEGSLIVEDIVESTEDVVTDEASEDAAVTEDTTATEDTAEVGTESGTVTEEENGAESEQTTYEDNFAVDADAAAAFADKIKAAVADQDMEALADLAFFPMYIGFTDGGESVDSREAFIELGEGRVFTNAMMESMAGASTDNLSASRAGFALSKDGRPNVIFGVVEGKLYITGMNF